MDCQLALGISDPSGVGEARRRAMALASSLGFDSSDAGRVGLVVTEGATNVFKHAGGGEVLLGVRREAGGRSGVEALVLDKGPGIPDVARAMQDGYSTAGSPGTGLGAIARLSSLAEIYSAPSRGTALLAQVFPRDRSTPPAPPPVEVGAVCVAAPGETVCGDDWAIGPAPGGGVAIMVADGLGHGVMAAKASGEAVRVFEQSSRPLAELFQHLHGALLATRGAAVSIAELEPRSGQVRFAGVGNVSGFLAWPGGSRSMVTQNGTVGGQLGTIRVSSYPWRRGAYLVIHSDGLTSRATVDGYPGLLARHPTLVAGVLYRDFARGRDDAAVVVATEGVRR